MQEALLTKGKPSLGPPVGIDIEGAGANSSWIKTAGATGSYSGQMDFSGGSVVDYLRIPYASSPFPTGENMEVRMRLIIYSTYENKPFFLISKFTGGTGANSADWSLFRDTAGGLRLTTTTTGGNPTGTPTGATIPLNQVFEIRWTMIDGTFKIYLDGTQVYTNTLAYRQLPIDWMLGTYLNAASTGATVNGTRAFWSLLGLRIRRLK